jgi:NAD(P)-dependent dehydrogenase (short-subunit alcohol dehydrogenase family)
VARKTAVITGAAQGMGLAAAQALAPDFDLLLADMNPLKLKEAADFLRQSGHAAAEASTDITEREQVKALAARAAETGVIGCVVNAAGISPSRADPETVFLVDAVGAAVMMEEFYEVMGAGSVYVNFTSTSPYFMRPDEELTGLLRMNPFDPGFISQNVAYVDRFVEKIGAKSTGSQSVRSGVSYGNAKWFVRDFTQRSAIRFARKGIRILSLAPGNVMTPMYFNEAKESCDKMLPKTPLGRHSYPYEIGNVVAFLVSERASCVCGVDIQADGGLAAGMTLPQLD